MFPPENLEDLNLIVEQRIEETARLDFKRQLPPSGKNDDVAQDLCAMANSEGGILIYGVGEDDMGRAEVLYPIPITGVAERVGLVARSRLDEPLALGPIHTIPCKDKEGHGFLVVEVPSSERAPHFVEGTAWARTSKGNVPLTRRRIGELFARSTGFADEFGLAVGRPGRVFVQQLDEGYPETVHGHLMTKRRYYLLFKNDGDAEVVDAAWEWVLAEGTDAPPPHVVEDPFPLEVLQPGVEARVPIFHTVGSASKLKVRTRWRDKGGKQHQQTWPIT